jgi:hypothetical protein
LIIIVIAIIRLDASSLHTTVCIILIAIVPVSAAVMAASIATIARLFVVVVVWFILSSVFIKR